MNKLSSYIFHLRSQPVMVRRQILIVTTFGITAIVILMWILSLSVTPHKISAKTKKEAPPFSVLKNNVIQIYANATSAWNSAKGGINQ